MNRVLVAGAAGAVGSRLVRRLLAAGDEVLALTRSSGRTALPDGVRPVVADLLDRDGLAAAVAAVRPEVVVHAAKAIPERGPLRFRDMDATNALHDKGTANLVAAAVAAGARRFIAESVVFAYGYGDLGGRPRTETEPPVRDLPDPRLHRVQDALLAMESHTLGQPDRIEGVVLRCGLYYGPGAGTEVMAKLLRRRSLPLPGGGRGLWPMVYVDDAAEALALAVTRGRGGDVYNIVDDEPVAFADFVGELARLTGARPAWSMPTWLSRLAASYLTPVALTVLPVSNDKAKRELGWRPRHPTFRDGLTAWTEEYRSSASAFATS